MTEDFPSLVAVEEETSGSAHPLDCHDAPPALRLHERTVKWVWKRWEAYLLTQRQMIGHRKRGICCCAVVTSRSWSLQQEAWETVDGCYNDAVKAVPLVS